MGTVWAQGVGAVHGGKGESLVPPHARGSVSLSALPERSPSLKQYRRHRTSGFRASGGSVYTAQEGLPGAPSSFVKLRGKSRETFLTNFEV